MLTYTRCYRCLAPTGDSLVCERCTALAEINSEAVELFNEQFIEEETDGFA